MKIIHLTDTHLVAPGETLYDLDPQARLHAAVDSINTLHADAEFCIISGDLTDRGETEAYIVLQEALERLHPPCHCIIGNHDSRQQVRELFPHIDEDRNGFLQYRINTPKGNFFMLDTVKTGTHAGAYCVMRQSWLEEQLQLFSDVNAYLVSHHPPFNIGIPSMDRISIDKQDARALGDMLQRHKQVRHLFFGHVHRPVNGSWNGISFSTIRSTNHQVALDLETDDMIPGCHEPPAYAVVLVDDNQVTVHAHDFMDTSKRFAVGSWGRNTESLDLDNVAM